MSLLPIHLLGSPVLRQRSAEVTTVDDEVRRVVEDMFETMDAAKGVGLAANQIGLARRIAVVDAEGDRFVMIDPLIVETAGSSTAEEGCLSIPEIYGDVTRAQHVVVRALDRDGKPIELDATDLLARCLQHEIDHLHGRLFIDYLSLLKRQAALKKWRKLRGKDKSLTRKVEPRDVAEHHERDEEL